MSCCNRYIIGMYRFIFRVGILFHKAFVWTRLNPPWKTPTHGLNPTILHLDLITWKEPANPGGIPTYSTYHLAPQQGVRKIHSIAFTKGKNKSPSNECSKHFGSGTPQKNLIFFFEAVPIFSRHTPSIETKWCSIDELLFTPKAQQVNVLPFKNITKKRLFF